MNMEFVSVNMALIFSIPNTQEFGNMSTNFLSGFHTNIKSKEMLETSMELFKLCPFLQIR